MASPSDAAADTGRPQTRLERVLGAAHRWVGLATIAVFVATGVLMRRYHLELLGADSGLRLLFRSRHVYLLFGGLLNLAVGLRYTVPPSLGRRSAGAVGSALLLVSPLLLAVAFFVEAVATGRSGPLSAAGVFAAVAGVAIQALSAGRAPNRAVSTTLPGQRPQTAGVRPRGDE